jgi:hypothetical protein
VAVAVDPRYQEARKCSYPLSCVLTIFFWLFFGPKTFGEKGETPDSLGVGDGGVSLVVRIYISPLLVSICRLNSLSRSYTLKKVLRVNYSPLFMP